MGQARLRSIEAVDEMAAALRRFGEESANALAGLDQELKRALEWIYHDRKDYWGHEVRQGFERVAEARADLERRMISRISDERPAATEEKKALEMAKRRLRIAEDKVQAVKRWSHVIEHELQEYVGIINQFSSWLQSDQPKALTLLKRMSQALEAYVNLPSSADDEAGPKQAAPTREGEASANLDSQSAPPSSEQSDDERLQEP